MERYAFFQEHYPSNNYLLHVIQKVKYIPRGSTSKGTREAATRTSWDMHHGSLWGLNCLKDDTLEQRRKAVEDRARRRDVIEEQTELCPTYHTSLTLSMVSLNTPNFLF